VGSGRTKGAVSAPGKRDLVASPPPTHELTTKPPTNPTKGSRPARSAARSPTKARILSVIAYLYVIAFPESSVAMQNCVDKHEMDEIVLPVVSTSRGDDQPDPLNVNTLSSPCNPS
jgi:hypothetical protein